MIASDPWLHPARLIGNIDEHDWQSHYVMMALPTSRLAGAF
jgi:hypothetical protein